MSGAVTIARARAVPYTIELAAPLRTSRGLLTHRSGWLLALEDEEGRTGWGDAASFPGFGSQAGAEALACRLAERITSGAWRGLQARALDDIAAILDVEARDGAEPEVRAALELALLDLLGQALRRPIARLFEEEAPRFARTHVLIAEPGQVDRAASRVKLKVGADLDVELRRVAELRAAAGGDVRIRLDAGGSWSPALARSALSRLARYGIELVEQPIAPGQLAAMAEVRRAAREHGIAVGADEDVRDEAALGALLEAGAADVLVLKPMFLGGLLACRRMAARAQREGVSAMITHALESAIGRTGAAHLAATLPGWHGLAWTVARDVAPQPERRGDLIALPAGDGLGVAPRGGARRHVAAIPHPLASSAIARPEHPALIAGRALTYGALAGEVKRAAAELAARGVRAGMTVALEGRPSADWVVRLHAVGWLGAAAAPLPPGATARERDALLAAFAPDVVVDASPPIPASGDEVPAAWWPIEEARVVVSTSGTTGAPRAIELSTWQLLTSAFGSAIRLGCDPRDRWLCCLPLHHVAGLSILFRSAFYGTTVLLHDRFDPARAARALDDGEVTLVSLTPTMLARLLDGRGDRPFSPSVRAILLGGEAASEALLDRCKRIAAPVALSWGMTEAASQIATRDPGDLAPLDRGLPPLPFASVSASRERLVVRGPLVAGELVTNDRGEVLPDGRVRILGRADDVIVSGGEKIDPAEVEAVLLAHPAVARAAVVPVASPRWGERPVAVLTRTAETLPTDDAMRAFCRAKLAAYKVPDGFVWLEALPATALGKIARRELSALARSWLEEREARR